MAFITTQFNEQRRYLMSKKDINKIFINIKNYSHKKIDRKILACAMSFVYHAGLQRNEIPILTIGDVYDQNRNVRNKIIKKEMKKGEMIIPADIRNELKKYYDYLESDEKYSTADTDPLFPGYYSSGSNREAELKKIGLHLEKIDPDYNKLIHNLHEMGMKDMRKQGLSEKKIAEQFRITDKSVHDSTTGKITLAGTKKLTGVDLINDKMVRLIDRLTILDYTDIKIIKDNIDNYYNEITSLPDKNLKKSGQGSKVGAFKRYFIELLREWK
jgi:integrase